MNEKLLREFLQSIHDHPLSSQNLSDEQSTMRNYCDDQSLIRLGTDECGRPMYFLTELGEEKLKSIHQKFIDESEKEANENAKQCAEKREAERLRIKDTRRSWWQFFLGLFIGWLLGGFTAREFFEWIRSLF